MTCHEPPSVGALDQRGHGSDGTHVAGDVVVHENGDGEPGLGFVALDGHETRGGGTVHVETTASGPRPARAVAVDRDGHEAGVSFRQLSGIEPALLERSLSVVVDHDVGAGEKGRGPLLADRTVEVDIGTAGADVGLGVDELVLVVVGAGGAEHVRSVLGQGPSDGRTGDGVGERQHPDAVERPRRPLRSPAPERRRCVRGR